MFQRTEDRHYRNASIAFGIPIEEVTREQRSFAKWCAFGAFSDEDALWMVKIGIRMVLAREELT